MRESCNTSNTSEEQREGRERETGAKGRCKSSSVFVADEINCFHFVSLPNTEVHTPHRENLLNVTVTVADRTRRSSETAERNSVITAAQWDTYAEKEIQI